MEPDQTGIFLALGSNLGDRLTNLAQARDELTSSVNITQASNIYETPPWGYSDQPAFLNQVLSGTTLLSPQHLLRFLKEIEQEMGRVKNFLNGPRLIDIDILLYGEQILHTPELTLPHPHMLERGFVLVLLAEIAPDLIIPGTVSTVTYFLGQVDRTGILKFDPTHNLSAKDEVTYESKP